MRSLELALKNRMSTVSFCRYVSMAVFAGQTPPNLLPPPADQVMKLKGLYTSLEIVQRYTHARITTQYSTMATEATKTQTIRKENERNMFQRPSETATLRKTVACLVLHYLGHLDDDFLLATGHVARCRPGKQ